MDIQVNETGVPGRTPVTNSIQAFIDTKYTDQGMLQQDYDSVLTQIKQSCDKGEISEAQRYSLTEEMALHRWKNLKKLNIKK